MSKNILMIGGDDRFIAVANTLSEYGFNVGMTAFKKSKKLKNNIIYIFCIFYIVKNSNIIF